MPFTDDEDYEKVARKIRVEGGIDDRFCPDMIFFLSELKRQGRITDYVTFSNLADEALYDLDTDIVGIRSDVFGALDHPYRSSKAEYQHFRFTIAHEVGHAVRKHEGIHFRGVTSVQVKKIPSIAKRNEREADRLASHILVPYHLAQQVMAALKLTMLAAEHIGDLFGINISAAKIAKERIDRMHRRQQGLPRALPKGIVDLLRGGQQQGYRVTSLEIEERRQREEAKLRGYEDIPCIRCKNYTVKRTDNRFRCETPGCEPG
jgi:hypothetical protein